GPQLYSSESLVVGNGDISNFTIATSPVFELTGSVKFENQQTRENNVPSGLTSMQLTLTPTEPWGISVGFLTETGTFTFSGLGRQSYQLRAFRPPAGWYLASARLDGEEVLF